MISYTFRGKVSGSQLITAGNTIKGAVRDLEQHSLVLIRAPEELGTICIRAEGLLMFQISDIHTFQSSPAVFVSDMATVKGSEKELNHAQEPYDMNPAISYGEGIMIGGAHTPLQTKRGIKSRHAQMMAIGGTIGTGLFVGTGEALYVSGPAMFFVAYISICILVYGIVTATSEMNSYLPVSGASMAYYGSRFVSQSLGFAMGWLYWYSFGIIVAYEVTAATVVISYWPNSVPIAVWITLILLVIIALNFCPVKIYGETEFWFASLKVFMIIGLLLLSFILFWGGGPNHHRLGFHYWKDPGAFKEYLATGNAGHFCAYLYVLCYSVFSFNFGPELIVFASAEMQNPRKNLPRAAKMFFYRMAVFYVSGTLAITVICSSDATGLVNGSGVAASPWVIAIQNAGIHGLDSVINAVIITSAWSAGNSYLFMSSRALYSLAVAGSAPKIFLRCNRWGVPYYAVLASSLFSLLAYMDCGSGSSVVFNWLVNLTNTAGFISWICCCVIFIRFRKAVASQSIPKSHLPYQSRSQPYMSWFAGIIFTILLFCNGFSVFFPGQWSVSSFFTSYIGLPCFLVLYFGHRIFNWKDKWAHQPSEVDLTSGLEEVEELEQEDSTPKGNVWLGFIRALWE